MAALPGVVRPGIASGAATSNTPSRSRSAAVPYVTARPQGSVFSAAIRAATNAIQAMLITPSAKSAAISPAAADAPRTGLRTHLERSGETAAPGPDQEPQRAPALSQADVLERGELVERRDDEDAAGEPTSGPVPGELVAEQAAPEIRESEREDSGGGPRQQIAGGEDERRERFPASRHAGVERDRRRDGGEHHRGHHHDPDADEPSERSEVRAGAVIHAAHAIDREPPGRGGESEQQNDQPEARAYSGQRRHEPRGPGGSRVRGLDHCLRRPRRTGTSTGPSSPRTRSRRR